jgi:hypothetical protein
MIKDKVMAQLSDCPPLLTIVEKQMAKGIEKYGQPLDDNDAPLEERINHALEEAIDLMSYLEWTRQITKGHTDGNILGNYFEIVSYIAKELVRQKEGEPF